MPRFPWAASAIDAKTKKEKVEIELQAQGPQDLHVEFRDGRAIHAAFTEELWTRYFALAHGEESEVTMMWLHPQAECLTPAEMMKKARGST